MPIARGRRATSDAWDWFFEAGAVLWRLHRQTRKQRKLRVSCFAMHAIFREFLPPARATLSSLFACRIALFAARCLFWYCSSDPPVTLHVVNGSRCGAVLILSRRSCAMNLSRKPPSTKEESLYVALGKDPVQILRVQKPAPCTEFWRLMLGEGFSDFWKRPMLGNFEFLWSVRIFVCSLPNDQCSEMWSGHSCLQVWHCRRPKHSVVSCDKSTFSRGFENNQETFVLLADPDQVWALQRVLYLLAQVQWLRGHAVSEGRHHRWQGILCCWGDHLAATVLLHVSTRFSERNLEDGDRRLQEQVVWAGAVRQVEGWMV